MAHPGFRLRKLVAGTGVFAWWFARLRVSAARDRDYVMFGADTICRGLCLAARPLGSHVMR